MSESDLIERLTGVDEYDALKKLTPTFNLFNLLDDALRSRLGRAFSPDCSTRRILMDWGSEVFVSG